MSPRLRLSGYHEATTSDIVSSRRGISRRLIVHLRRRHYRARKIGNPPRSQKPRNWSLWRLLRQRLLLESRRTLSKHCSSRKLRVRLERSGHRYTFDSTWMKYRMRIWGSGPLYGLRGAERSCPVRYHFVVIVNGDPGPRRIHPLVRVCVKMGRIGAQMPRVILCGSTHRSPMVMLSHDSLEKWDGFCAGATQGEILQPRVF